MKYPSISFNAHAVACAMTIAIAVGLLFSPPLANLAELLLVVVVFGSGELRHRLWGMWRVPAVKLTVVFYVVIGLGVLYSMAPNDVSLRMLNGWRKVLLLPIALSLFSEELWKRRFLGTFVSVVTLSAMISFFLWGLNLPLSVAPHEPGVLLRNHATQGMMFAVGAFGAVFLALENRNARLKWFFFIAALVLVANIVQVTPGRSGYLVLLICTAAAVLGYLKSGNNRWGAKGIAVVILAGLGVLSALLLSPASRERIELAIHETQHYDQSTEVTSMGIRIIFWKNAIELIQERPLLGYGTGAFKDAYGRKVAGREGVAGTESGDPHNQYLKIAAEHGVIGLIVFLALLIAVIRLPASQPWRLLGLGVMGAWCATSLFNSHFSTFNEGTFIYAWLGVMLAHPLPQAEVAA